MILSICIPVYNFIINDLVVTLQRQIEQHSLDAEIIIIDDGSTSNVVALNQCDNGINTSYIVLPKNIGRSKIRNYFLRFAKGDYLLFLDCDGRISNQDFLKIYCDYIAEKYPKVIYGGRVLPNNLPSDNYKLRWNFASQRENLSLEKRLLKPYRSFQTNNFVVKKDVFSKFNFNEKLNQYGYEDLLFAMDLKMANIPIDHIQNPIINDDVETNQVFLSKATESAQSLALILKDEKNISKVSELRLAKAYFFLKKNYLVNIYCLLFTTIRPLLTHKLKSGNGDLRWLDLYKLGILCQSMKRSA